jgi:hypothetical protein
MAKCNKTSPTKGFMDPVATLSWWAGLSSALHRRPGLPQRAAGWLMR